MRLIRTIALLVSAAFAVVNAGRGSGNCNEDATHYSIPNTDKYFWLTPGSCGDVGFTWPLNQGHINQLVAIFMANYQGTDWSDTAMSGCIYGHDTWDWGAVVYLELEKGWRMTDIDLNNANNMIRTFLNYRRTNGDAPRFQAQVWRKSDNANVGTMSFESVDNGSWNEGHGCVQVVG